MRWIVAMIASVMVIGFTADADAKPRKKIKSADNLSVVLRELRAVKTELAAISRKLNPDIPPPAIAFDVVPPPEAPRNPVLDAPIPLGKTLAGYEKHIAKSAKLKDLTPGLANKVAEILGSCDTKITSGYRRGARVRGSGRASLHSLYPSQAADLVGDPRCIYRHLAKWPGGYSVDYAAVRHVHVSLGGRERGARFVHYRGSRYAKHHARKSHRYATRPNTYQSEPYQKHAVAR